MESYTENPNTYFGQRGTARGKIQRWYNYPTRGFPYENNCEECGWMINIAEKKIVTRNGFTGTSIYHEHCWESKKKDNRLRPKWYKLYGYKWSNDNPHTEDDWVWNIGKTRFEKHCIKCDKMIAVQKRAQQYETMHKGTDREWVHKTTISMYPDKCGWCMRKEEDE